MIKNLYLLLILIILLSCDNSTEPIPTPVTKEMEVSVIPSNIGIVNAVAISRLSSAIAWGGSEITVKLNGRGDLKSHLNSITCLDFSDDEKYLLSGSSDHLIKLWNVKTGDLITTFSEHLSRNWSIKFMSDGNGAVSGQDEHVIYWTNIATGPIGRLTMFGHTSRVASVDVSPDELTILSASYDGTIKLWKESGELVQTLIGHVGPVYCAAFSPADEKIASCGADSTIVIWDAASFQKLNSFKHHSAPVKWLSYHPSGNYIASAGNDSTIYLFSSANGSVINKLNGHTGFINKVKFSANGNALVSGSNDKTVRVWNNVFALKNDN